MRLTRRVSELCTYESTGSAAEGGEPFERSNARQKEVGPSAQCSESRQTLDRLADRPLGNLEIQRPVLRADERIMLVAEFVKVSIVDPHVLRELELADEVGATDKGSEPPFHAVLGRAFG